MRMRVRGKERRYLKFRGVYGMPVTFPGRPATTPGTVRYHGVVPKKVLLAWPRGYCAGVDRAVDAVERALRIYGPPVYVRKQDRKSTRLNSSHSQISYAVFCLKKKTM